MLERISWWKARELFQRTKVALVPVGSTEQHGPHLPLGTDFLTAHALAQSVARELNLICTPVVPIGVSEHHRQFWGTLWVSPETFRRYMKEIAQSLASHGVRRIVFVNGHGGNNASLQEICRELRAEKIFAVLWAWWLDPEVQKLTAELFRSRGTHAGAIETSIILAVDPSLVERSQLEAAARGASEIYATSRDGAQLPLDTIDFSQSGATLDPREASQEAGQKIFHTACERLRAIVQWLEHASEEELSVKPHLP
uniref:Creatininase n=2 Tax=Candidatus Bipolaricaulota TaxID=67810 RepID=H5SN11_9BACT|nr:creatininase [uncultured Acetothermia bacterium]BAL58982.1 creatininase [Candidatus Acetothermum autotrophicum]